MAVSNKDLLETAIQPVQVKKYKKLKKKVKGFKPEVFQSFVDHVLDKVDLQGAERSVAALAEHLDDVLGQRGGDGRCRQGCTWRTHGLFVRKEQEKEGKTALTRQPLLFTGPAAAVGGAPWTGES